MPTDAKKLFHEVFSQPNKIGSDLPSEKRGVPVQLTAFDVYHIHTKLKDAYKGVIDTQRELNSLSWKLHESRIQFVCALKELEIRIYEQEKESGIGGSEFTIYKGDEDGTEE